MLNSNLGGVVGQLFFFYIYRNVGRTHVGKMLYTFGTWQQLGDAVRNKRIIVARYTLADFATKTRGDAQLVVVEHLDSFLTKSKCFTTIN